MGAGHRTGRRTESFRQLSVPPVPRTGSVAATGPSGESRRSRGAQFPRPPAASRTVSVSAPAPNRTRRKPIASPYPRTEVAASPRSAPRSTAARSACKVAAASGPSVWSRISFTAQGFSPGAVSSIRG